MFVFPCPHCGHALRTSQALAPGNRLQCGKCGQTFAAMAQPVPAADRLSQFPRRKTRSPVGPAPARKTHPLGPTAEEYANFDEASKPRPLAMKPWQVVNLLVIAVIVVLMLYTTLAAALLYGGGQPQNRILGRWQAADHPTIAALEFFKNGHVAVTFKNQATENATYYFLARSTVQINLFAFPDGIPPDGQWAQRSETVFRIRMEGNRMTTIDLNAREQPRYSWVRTR